jgi:hypothetical protein
MKLFLLSFILIGMVATTTAAEPRHHRDEPQDHDDGGRVFGRSMSKRQDAVGETKKINRAARGHRHRYVVVVPPTTTGKATKRVNGPRKHATKP